MCLLEDAGLMAQAGYKVRIRQPESGEAGMLATMIAPFINQDVDALEARLREGPAVVEDLERADAEQLVGLFARMGAVAELVVPESAMDEASEEPSGVAWRTMPFRAEMVESALRDAAVMPAIRQTQPFNARALRDALEERGGLLPSGEEPLPPVPDTVPMAWAEPKTATQPFSAAALRQAMAEAVLPARDEGARPPATRPLDADQIAHHAAKTRPRRTTDGPGSPRRTETKPPPAPLRGAPSGRLEPPPRALPGVGPLHSLPPPVTYQPPPDNPVDASLGSVKTASVAFANVPDGPPATAPRPRRGLVTPRPSPGRSEALTPRPAAARVPQVVSPRAAPPSRPSGPLAHPPARPSGAHPPVRPSGGHPLPDPLRGMAIRDRITDGRDAPWTRHSPARAALLSLVLPGMGQVYNGQRNRAIWFALGALVVLPWIWGVVDAWVVAAAVVDRRHPAPERRARTVAIPGQLVLDLAVYVAIAGAVYLYQARRGPAPAPIGPDAPPSAPRTTAAGSALTAAPRTTPTEDRAPATSPAAQRSVETLLAAGRTACGEGNYAECEQLMRQVIERAPQNQEAYRLLVDARSQRDARSGQRTAPMSAAPTSEAPE